MLETQNISLLRLKKPRGNNNVNKENETRMGKGWRRLRRIYKRRSRATNLGRLKVNFGGNIAHHIVSQPLAFVLHVQLSR